MNIEGNFCMIKRGFIEDSLKEKDFENGLILGNFWEIMWSVYREGFIVCYSVVKMRVLRQGEVGERGGVLRGRGEGVFENVNRV